MNNSTCLPYYKPEKTYKAKPETQTRLRLQDFVSSSKHGVHGTFRVIVWATKIKAAVRCS